MVADAHMNYLGSLRNFSYTAVAPLYQAISLPIRSAQELAQNFSQHRLLLAENQNLRDQNLLLQVQLQRLDDLRTENRHLRGLFGSAPRFVEKMLIAEVMAVDLDPFSRKMIINKGVNQEVQIGLPVFDAQGVMGQVIETGTVTSRVMLITDPDHTLPVQVARTGLHTLVAGTGAEGELDLLYLPNTAELHIGDKLITSGLGGRFPRGYPVAVVTHFKPVMGQPYAEAKARPSALLDRNRDVLLIWPLKEEIQQPVAIVPAEQPPATAESTTEQPSQ